MENRQWIDLQSVSKSYQVGDIRILALESVSFSIKKGEFVVILGPSGAGKTTLLNLLGGMDIPDQGHIYVDGKDIAQFKQAMLTQYRRHDIGFVFQFYNLMPNLTALENVELATELCKDARDPKEVLVRVGLQDRMHNFPSQLSGGEQQRVSIARALAKNPKVLLCDEPTGALDVATGKHILSLLSDVARKEGNTVVVVTHNSAIKYMADTIIYVKNGKVETIEHPENILDVSQIDW